MRSACTGVLSVTILALGALPALAQPVVSAKSGLVSYTEGKVMMGDKAVEPTATSFPEVKENSVLRTEEGRAEVLMTMGIILRMGENASFKMISSRLIDSRMELLSGSHIVEADEIQKDNNLALLAKEATVNISKRGLYRFDIDQNRLKVFDGTASVQVNGQTVLVGAGKMMPIDGSSLNVEKFDKEATDALDNWAKRRGERLAMANASSAKQVHDYGCTSQMNFAQPVATTNPCYNPCGGWRYNPWYGLITYIPCGANVYSPYGYRYWSPYNVMRAYYVPPTPVYNRGNGGGFGNQFPSYSSMGQTSAGYSGAMSTSTSSVSSSTAMGTSAGTSSGAAASSSAGHGGGGGGRGR